MKQFLRKISFLILIFLLSVNGMEEMRRTQSHEIISEVALASPPPKRSRSDTTAKDYIPKVRVNFNLFGALLMLKRQLKERVQQKEVLSQPVPIETGVKSTTSPGGPTGYTIYNYIIFNKLITTKKLNPTK